LVHSLKRSYCQIKVSKLAHCLPPKIVGLILDV
jgi:hypothetical protein